MRRLSKYDKGWNNSAQFSIDVIYRWAFVENNDGHLTAKQVANKVIEQIKSMMVHNDD